MSIPVSEAWPPTDPDLAWSALDGDGKRARLLHAAGRVFARDGLEAPMPAVAAEAGAGVASLYRQFPSKHDLVAALVVRRLEQSRDAAAAALDTDGDRWEAFTDTLRTLVERFSADDFLGEARMLVDDHPDVVAAADRATEAFEQLMAQARAGGRLRADATTTDVRLLFAATRAAKKVEPDGWRRTLELFIDALDAKAR